MKTRISVLISKAALLLLILIASVLMPFNISADTITTANIIGTTVNLIDTNTLGETVQTTSGGTVTKYNVQYNYEVSVQLDNNYVGYLDLSIAGQYATNLVSLTYNNFDYRRKVFINGDVAKFSFSITSWYSSDPLSRNAVSGTPSVTINDSGVTLISELDSIDQIITILNDLYNSVDDLEGLENNQLLQLQQIVSNTSIANDYLDLISRLRQYNIPLESFIYQQYFIRKYPDKIRDINDIRFNFPIYNLSSGDLILDTWIDRNKEFYLTFISTLNVRVNVINDYLNIVNATPVEEIYSNFMGGSYPLYFKTIKFKQTNYNVQISIKQNSIYFIPVYFGYGDDLTTDFALSIGLKNDVLNNLDKIANGTTESNQQSQDLSSGTDSMQDQMDDLVGIEDSYNQQFNNSVDSIDFNNPLQQNQGLLGASNFVITVFNGLIANNPFSILIIIVCILLIGKKVIGK